MIAFVVQNVLLIPFAYIASLIKKIKLQTNTSKRGKKKNPTLDKYIKQENPWSDFIFFLILGPLLLLACAVRDTYHFAVDIYRDDVKELGLGEA